LKFSVAKVHGTPGAVVAEPCATEMWDSGLRPEKTRERFASVFGKAPIGRALIDLDGGRLQVNDALCRITGYTERELRHATLPWLTHPEDVEINQRLHVQLLADQIPSCQVEKLCRHLWDHFFWVQEHVTGFD
jgi:PAS domain S-box-containing protein